MSEKPTLKPGDGCQQELEVIQFFAKLTPGWTVERPAPSIERVSAYVLDRGTVHLTEYQGAGFTVYVPAVGPFVPEGDSEADWAAVLAVLKSLA